ncbi:hypothetical protein [Streptomyces sp. NBC_00859]|uniref:hypothetical protein n=1 Tax=Streptomyces sp. NBC_00859 TaxID=2903682 RepID=UPI003865FC16|nr:hypothetical protein OG584_19510 [Streptomyces sp. NBC_00859]
MTPSPADHAQMSVEDFEELARHAPETYGTTLTLPAPVSITLETGKLKDYVR